MRHLLHRTPAIIPAVKRKVGKVGQSFMVPLLLCQGEGGAGPQERGAVGDAGGEEGVQLEVDVVLAGEVREVT